MQTFLIEDNKLSEIQNRRAVLFGEKNIFCILSPNELSLIPDIDKVAKYTVKECQMDSHHLRIDYHQGNVYGVQQSYIYGILSTIEVSKNKLVSIDFNFYLTDSSLVLVSKKNNKFLETFVASSMKEEFMQVYETVTPKILFLHLINTIIENNEDYMEKVEDGLEKLEEKILINAKKEYSKEIVAKRKLIMQLRHRVESFPCLTKMLSENENDIFEDKQLKTINILDYKATKMADNATLLRDYVSQIREAFEAERDMKTNELMKIFTIVTSIFLPLTLIAGWYGMNFSTMPELTWKYGYVYVITLSISVVASLIFFFKKKKLLK